MKKLLILTGLLLTLFIPINANAGIKNTTSCDKATVDSEGKNISVCYIDVTITDSTKLYKIDGKISFNNSSLKSIETTDPRITIVNNDPANLVFEASEGIKNEKIRLAKVTIYISSTGTNCNITWQPTEYGINYSCDIIGNKYYDLKGNLTDFATYDKECNHYCEIVDNKYYGKNGNIVDEKTYDKECNKHLCEIIDNEYFDNNGNIVSEKEYNKACGKYSCVIVDDEYYDESGKLVDKATWEEICTIPENPTTGSDSIIWTAIIGIIVLGFIIIITKKSTKLYKI